MKPTFRPRLYGPGQPWLLARFTATRQASEAFFLFLPGITADSPQDSFQQITNLKFVQPLVSRFVSASLCLLSVSKNTVLSFLVAAIINRKRTNPVRSIPIPFHANVKHEPLKRRQPEGRFGVWHTQIACCGQERDSHATDCRG